jgi:hypothetical protein
LRLVKGYSHKHPQYGYLLRVFDFLSSDRPETPESILSSPLLFNCFYSLVPALSQKLVSVAFHVAVPEDFSDFPLFRTCIPGRSGKIESWSLWNGETSRLIGIPTESESKISPLGAWNHALLVHRISVRWKPEMHV